MKKQNICFFGDSWFWTWESPIRSTLLANNYFEKGVYTKRKSFYPEFFSIAEFSVESHCLPGRQLDQSTEALLKYIPENNDIIVLFVSDIVRENETLYNEYDITNYDSFMNKLRQNIKKQYNLLGEYSKEFDIPVLLLGGQASVIPELVDTSYTNLHIVSECIANDLFYNKKYKYFRLCAWSNYINENWDKQIISEVYEHTTEYHNDIDVLREYFHHDMGHPDVRGQLYITDMIIKYMEENKLIKD